MKNSLSELLLLYIVDEERKKEKEKKKEKIYNYHFVAFRRFLHEYQTCYCTTFKVVHLLLNLKSCKHIDHIII